MGMFVVESKVDSSGSYDSKCSLMVKIDYDIGLFWVSEEIKKCVRGCFYEVLDLYFYYNYCNVYFECRMVICEEIECMIVVDNIMLLWFRENLWF